MPERTVEDRLREEYFDLLPVIQRVTEHLEAEIKHRLLPITRTLDKHEQIVVTSRIKECESALESLRQDQESRTFAQEQPELYTLTSLKDLAGVRVSVFPRKRIEEINSALRTVFKSSNAKPILGDNGQTLVHKYWGYCSEASNQIAGEYQIVPTLIGLFWTVEHSALYQPSPRLNHAIRLSAMQQRYRDVLTAVEKFEDEFELAIRRKQGP